MTPSFAERELASVEPRRLARFRPAPAPATRGFRELASVALAHPVESPPLGRLARAASRVCVLLSDASREEPRGEMLDALLEHLAPEQILLVVAAGTHVADDGVIPERFSALKRVVHDGRRAERMCDLGRTARGTRVRLLAEVAGCDLVVVTSRIRPHYFAGFSGGTKGVFPGVAHADDALQNHLLKADPSAGLGRVDDNVCRLDMEEAALRLRVPIFALNVLADVDGNAVAAASGHPIAAHRALVPGARELFGVSAPRSPVVVVADRPPVSRSLYQASKLIPPAGALLEDGGTVIVVAECDLGTGPAERVNDGIYRLGVARQLPARHRVVLVSRAPESAVRQSYAEPAENLSAALDDAFERHGVDRAVVLWRAGECIADALQSNP